MFFCSKSSEQLVGRRRVGFVYQHPSFEEAQGARTSKLAAEAPGTTAFHPLVLGVFPTTLTATSSQTILKSCNSRSPHHNLREETTSYKALDNPQTCLNKVRRIRNPARRALPNMQ